MKLLKQNSNKGNPLTQIKPLDQQLYDSSACILNRAITGKRISTSVTMSVTKDSNVAATADIKYVVGV